jgi:hypothetical protein
VDSSLTLGRLVRNVLLLAVLGFIAVQLAKPLLTVALMVLAFALVGFLLWLPIHSLVFGRQAPVRQGLDQGQALSRRALTGLRIGWARVAGWAVALAPAALEIVSGAVLGSLLVWAHIGQRAETESLGFGALAGAAVGGLVVLARRRPVTGQLPETEPHPKMDAREEATRPQVPGPDGPGY